MALMIGIGAIAVQQIVDRDMSHCRIPAIGFGAQPDGDPDASARDWLSVSYPGPVEMASVKEHTDEQGRPERVVTWTTGSARKVKTSMVRDADGTWHGGLDSVGC
jgi:hypothetical protein